MDQQYTAISTTMDALRNEVAEVATLKLARRLEVARRFDSMWHFVTMLAISAIVGPVGLLANPADYSLASTMLSAAAAVVAIWHFCKLISAHTCIDMIDIRLAEIKAGAYTVKWVPWDASPEERKEIAARRSPFQTKIGRRDVGVIRDPNDDRDGPVAPGGIRIEAAARSVA